MSGLGSKQILLFDGLKSDQLQSYIDKIKEIKDTTAEIFANSPEDQQGLDIGQYQDYANALSDLEPKQAALLLSTQGLTNAQIAETLALNGATTAENYKAMADAGLLARKQTLTAAQIQENLQTVLGAEADTSAAMSSLGLSSAIELQEHQTVQLTAKKLREAVATGALTEAQAQEFAMRTGVILSMKTQSASVLPKWIASLKACTLAIWDQVKATAVWLATTPAGWATAAIAAIVAVGTALFGMSKAVDEAKEKAREFGEELKASREEIDNFKSQVEELNDVIENNESSIDDVANARSNLLDIQDQLIEKYGKEEDTIKLITAAINGEVDAWDRLAKKEYDAKVEDFDEDKHPFANFFRGYSPFAKNSEVAIGEMQDAEAYLGRGIGNLNEEQQKIVNNFVKQLSSAVKHEGNMYYSLDGNVYEVQDNLKKVKEYVESIFDPNEDGVRMFIKALDDMQSEMEDTVDSYGDFYNQYVLANEILTKDSGYADNYRDIIRAYSDYQDAFNSNDKQAIEESKREFSDAMSQAITEASENDDWGVVEYFKNMYPALYSEISDWKFDIDLNGHITIADSNGENTTANEILNDVAKQFSGMTAEEIEAGNISGDWTDEQIKAYNDLIALAALYQIDMDAIIEKMCSIGLYIPKMVDEEAMNAIDKIVGNSNSESANNYYKNADATDQAAMRTDEYISALKEQSKEIEEGTRKSYDYAEALKSVTEVESEPLSYTDSVSKVENTAKKLDTLMKVYDDVKDGGEFDWSSILNNDEFEEMFSSAGEVYDEFIQTITNNPDDITACQDAFDRLATSVIYNSDLFDGLTKDTKDATIAMLEQSGVVNAAELVNKRLAVSEEYAALTGKELKDATLDDIASLLELGTASDETTNYLLALATQKIDLNNLKLDTKSDVDNICAIANAAGSSAEYVDALRSALEALQNAQSAKETYQNNVKNRSNKNVKIVGNDGFGAAFTGAPGYNPLDNTILGLLDYQIEQAQAKVDSFNLDELFANIQSHSLNASDFYAKTGGSSKNSSSDSAKETVETFNWIETAISRIQRFITNLGKTVSATYRNWSTRNDALASEMNKVVEDISLQQQAYDAYMAKANSIGLSDFYKNLVQNGGIRIEDITDETLKEQISAFKEW